MNDFKKAIPFILSAALLIGCIPACAANPGATDSKRERPALSEMTPPDERPELTEEQKAEMLEKAKAQLAEKLKNGEITQEEYDQAIADAEAGKFKPARPDGKRPQKPDGDKTTMFAKGARGGVKPGKIRERTSSPA